MQSDKPRLYVVVFFEPSKDGSAYRYMQGYVAALNISEAIQNVLSNIDRRYHGIFIQNIDGMQRRYPSMKNQVFRMRDELYTRAPISQSFYDTWVSAMAPRTDDPAKVAQFVQIRLEQ